MKKEKVKIDLQKEVFQKMEQLHPHQVMLYVSMIGSAIIFLFMLVAFSVSRPEATDFIAARFPRSFMVSTVLLLLSDFSISKVVPAFTGDNMAGLKKWLGVTFLLGVVFAMCQVLGWKELQENGIFFSGQRSGAYLYVISGLHVVHMLGIMTFLLVLLMECHQVSKDTVKHLMYATSPYQKIKLRMLTDSWRFVDVLWIILFFYLLFTF